MAVAVAHVHRRALHKPGESRSVAPTGSFDETIFGFACGWVFDLLLQCGRPSTTMGRRQHVIHRRRASGSRDRTAFVSKRMTTS